MAIATFYPDSPSSHKTFGTNSILPSLTTVAARSKLGSKTEREMPIRQSFDCQRCGGTGDLSSNQTRVKAKTSSFPGPTQKQRARDFSIRVPFQLTGG